MKAFLLCAALFCAVTFAGPPQITRDSPWIAPPLGRLGYTIGTYLTIEGVRAEKGKVGRSTLLVDKVGEYRLEEPVPIWVDNVDLPSVERCILKGYESGRWIGISSDVAKAIGSESQAIWQFQFYFLATSIEQPRTAKLR